MVVFIDDILVYSRIKEEHAEHLHTVLETLEVISYMLCLKCDFWM